MDNELTMQGFDEPEWEDDLYGRTDKPSPIIEESHAEYRTIRDYRDLRVWQLAMNLAVSIYESTGKFPSEERFGLISQLRRAAVSVPSNIAEGNTRNSTADYLRFLRIARGSLAEINTQLLLAEHLGYLNAQSGTPLLSRTDELMRQLTSMYAAIERSANKNDRSL